ncbi:MAG: VWA domain-containing protein [Rubripirellula sp.]
MFYHPWFLILLCLVPWLAWRMWRSANQHSVPFSSIVADWELRPTWRQRLAWLPQALTLLALTLMILSLARPRYGREQTVIHSEGIAIEMVVDRSGSMQALDFEIDGSPVDRLTAIKSVAAKFVMGDQEDQSSDQTLAGRLSDLVGLIVFAGYADAITPPTLDHAFLLNQLEQTQIVRQRSEDGTAIGDAISLAVEKLSSLDQRQSEKVKSKVVILLTDGENTAGAIDPLQAAGLAKALDIRIYTIGVGTKGRAPFPIRRNRNGSITVDYMEVTIDEEMLKGIANETGGKYFRATDTSSLEDIYESIDELEKTKVETQQFMNYREIAVQPSRLAGYRLPPLLLLALLALLARVALARTVFRQMAFA